MRYYQIQDPNCVVSLRHKDINGIFDDEMVWILAMPKGRL